MTSIATTTIITAIPMLMTVNKPPKARRDGQAVASEQSVPASDQGEFSASEAANLYRLMTWLSPAFPVGAFSYSSGIEWAVEAGDITDAISLRHWLTSMLVDGSGICDCLFLAHAYRAAASNDDAKLAEVAELAAVFVPSRERHLETTAQGRAFIEIARTAWNCEGFAGSADRALRKPLSSIRSRSGLSAPRTASLWGRRFTPSCMR